MRLTSGIRDDATLLLKKSLNNYTQIVIESVKVMFKK